LVTTLYACAEAEKTSSDDREGTPKNEEARDSLLPDNYQLTSTSAPIFNPADIPFTMIITEDFTGTDQTVTQLQRLLRFPIRVNQSNQTTMRALQLLGTLRMPPKVHGTIAQMGLLHMSRYRLRIVPVQPCCSQQQQRFGLFPQMMQTMHLMLIQYLN
jgi:hypothetical protein